MTSSAAICCSFVFEPGDYDDEFHTLDDEIDHYARGLEGFQEVVSWYSRDGRFTNAMYFFSDMDSVRKLASFPTHKEAKKKFARWYRSYEVTIMEVKGSYSGTANVAE
jgi:hypothetical protein